MQWVSWRNIIRLLSLCLLLGTSMGANIANAAPAHLPQGNTVEKTEGVVPGCGTDDFYTAHPDTAIIIGSPGVLANDRRGTGAPNLSTLVTGPAHGTLILKLTGEFIYIPDKGFWGNDTFVYAMKCFNVEGAPTPGTATVTISVARASCAAVDDVYTTPVDTLLTVAAPGVLQNDRLEDPHWTNRPFTLRTAHGFVTMETDGSFTFMPDTGFIGSDSFKYVVTCDDHWNYVAVVTLMVKDVPVTPTPTMAPVACAASSDSYTTAQDTALTVAAPGVLGNDMGTGASVAYVGTSPAHGSVSQAADGSFTYTPDAGYVGPDSYTYVIGCTGGSDSVGTVTIDVTAPMPQDATPVVGD